MKSLVFTGGVRVGCVGLIFVLGCVPRLYIGDSFFIGLFLVVIIPSVGN